MYRFFVNQDQVEDTVIHITGSDVNHIRNVLRMKQGEKILISSKGTGSTSSDFPETGYEYLFHCTDYICTGSARR